MQFRISITSLSNFNVIGHLVLEIFLMATMYSKRQQVSANLIKDDLLIPKDNNYCNMFEKQSPPPQKDKQSHKIYHIKVVLSRAGDLLISQIKVQQKLRILQVFLNTYWRHALSSILTATVCIATSKRGESSSYFSSLCTLSAIELPVSV